MTDMPAGWNESQRQVFEHRQAENPSIDPSVWCEEAKTIAQPLIALAGESGADVEMSKPGDGGNGASMMRLQAWSNKDVQEYLSSAKRAATACNGTSTTDENGATATMTSITNKSIGDESVSFSQRVEPPSGTKGEKFVSVGRTTIARFGNTLMVLQIGDAGPDSTVALMNETQWWNIVNLAANKLKR